MDPWDKTNSLDHHHRRQDHRHPSFSSTLLDQIYNSIDSSSLSDVSMRKKQNRAVEEIEKILVNRRAVPGDSVRSRNLKTAEPVFSKHSSSSSSSDSSGLSSSSSDSFYRRSRSPPEIPHPKPIRTTVERRERPNDNNNKVKSKALEMYSDLKRVKQPNSPGGRLATFLNSIFTGNTKKPNKTATSSSTTCSSASSFSKSCLSKTPSSSEKLKRSVRFLMEENRRVIEAAKELIRTYQKNKDVVNIIGKEEEDDDEDDDDDGASCASSDLFELDHLSVIGIGSYREELPVYETTRFNTNRIISR
ncbi:BnaC03g70000D [Brassica napus]|uniref:BnaC03g70000D protein n=1 Tax=Brassica napus TaxID=3708 RepID=A0A078FCE1_BRANA|nr:BnaC03g70000D [Brassica napus]